MWRLSYQGDRHLAGGGESFWLFGSSRFTLELPFLLMSAGATVMIWRIGLRFLSPFQSGFAALAFWLWPAIFVWVSVKPLLFYVPHDGARARRGLVCAAGRRTSRPHRRLVPPRPRRRGRMVDVAEHHVRRGPGGAVVRRLPPARDPARRPLRAPCAVLGVPWIWNQATYGLTAFRLKPGQAQGDYLDHLGYFFTHALPTALGLRAPIAGDWVLDAGGPVLYFAALGLLALSLAMGLRERSAAAVGLLPPVRVRLESRGVGPRYRRGRQRPVLLLLHAVPPRSRSHGSCGRSPAVVMAVALAASSVWGFARLYEVRDSIGVVRPLDRVIERLEREGYDEVFASFWVSSPHVRERRADHRGGH